MKTKKVILFYAVLIMFFSCNVKENNIRIGILDGPSFISFIQLIDEPPVIKGRKVEFIVKSEPLQIQAMMMQNKLDFAVLPTVMAANLYNKGVDFRLVAIPVWGTLYLMSNDPEIDNLNQIKNQKVHLFGQGSTSDILFREFLNKNNHDKILIDYSYSSNMELSNALLQHKIKLAIVSEPLVSILLTKDPAIKILTEIKPEDTNSNDYESLFAQTAFLVNSSYADKYRNTINIISAYYAESCDFTYQQPEISADLLVKHNFYPDKETALRSIPLCNIQFRYAADAKESIFRYLKIFHTFEPKSIGGKMPDDRFIYTDVSD